jgi:Bor protein
MRRTVPLALLAAALGALAGCHPVRYQTRADPAGPRHERTVHFFFWGVAGGADLDLDALCPRGVASVEERAGAADRLLDLATLGVYARRTVAVTCAGTSRP